MRLKPISIAVWLALVELGDELRARRLTRIATQRLRELEA